MNFLAPLFLFGAAAVLAPIVFHLIRRTTREVTPFSTLMFLQPTPPRVTRRSRLENLWLLLLRCLVIALLALGFARPFLKDISEATQPPAASGKRVVFLIDTSASMRRESLWNDARSKLDEHLRKTTLADEVAVLTFDGSAQTVVSFADWNATNVDERPSMVSQRLATLSPGWNATQLGVALIHSAELFDQSGREDARPRQIIVISDLQEGCRLDGLQGYEWSRGIEVAFDTLTARLLQNVSAQWISETEETVTVTDAQPMRLRVTNSAESKREQFQLLPANADATAKLDVYVPAGQTRLVRVPQQPPERQGSFHLTGDEVEFDNTVFVLPPQIAQVPVLFLGQDAADDPKGSLYYLRRAFPKTSRQNIEVISFSADQPLSAHELEKAQLMILGENVSDDALTSARQFARAGRIVVIPLTAGASAQTLSKLLENASVQAPEAPPKDYALLAQIDFQHPLFAPFADPRFSDFTKIHFWKHRRLDPAVVPGARVVASFDGGDPAIVQVPLGQGSVVIFTSSWRPTDSQLALSSKFVPLLHALLEQSSNSPMAKAQHFVGDEVPLPSAPQPFTIRKPDGAEVTVAGGSKFSATDLPGIYVVKPGTLRFVVNLAPEESRLSPMPLDRLVSLGVPMQKAATEAPTQTAQRQQHVQAAEIENRQKLWRWLIIAAVAMLLIETWFAARATPPVSTA